MNCVERLQELTKSVEMLAKRYARTSPQILAVSKTHPAELVEQAYRAGQRAFGENYIAEAVQKSKQLPEDIEWHLLGPVQSNKTALVAAHFHWLHSLDRSKIAERLSLQRAVNLPPLNVLIQLNISEEDSKSGLHWQDQAGLAELVHTIESLPKLALRGVMAMAAPGLSLSDTRAQFARARMVYEQLQKQISAVDTLSMGMSADLEAAIAEGSTLVRVGTAIFGTRAP